MTTITSAPGTTGVTVPILVEEITPAWLSDALSVQNPGTRIASIDSTDVIWGTATKVLLTVTYAAHPGPDGPPPRLCVKGGFDERVRAAMATVGDEAMRTEGNFFRDLAPRVTADLPRTWFADTNDLHGVVVFDDLSAQGVVFGDPLEPWSPELVRSGLDQLARLHGGSWGQSYSDVPWVTKGAEPVKTAARHLFGPHHWDDWFAKETSPVLPERLRDRERNLRAYEALWDVEANSVSCLSHSDAHLGNTFIDEGRGAFFLDWASVAKCPWSYDVAYFIVGALTINDRRTHERELLEHYLVELEQHGGPRLDRDQAWIDYRRHCLHGLIWSTVPPVLQSAESVNAMSERYVAAIMDHDPFSLLGV